MDLKTHEIVSLTAQEVFVSFVIRRNVAFIRVTLLPSNHAVAAVDFTVTHLAFGDAGTYDKMGNYKH